MSKLQKKRQKEIAKIMKEFKEIMDLLRLPIGHGSQIKAQKKWLKLRKKLQDNLYN